VPELLVEINREISERNAGGLVRPGRQEPGRFEL
jgi:hypothetical protein